MKHLFNQSFSVYTVTTSQDTGGAATKAETLSVTANGFIEPLTGSDERIVSGKPELNAQYRLYCENSVAMSEGDRIDIAGSKYEVVFVANFNQEFASGKGNHKEVLLRIRE